MLLQSKLTIQNHKVRKSRRNNDILHAMNSFIDVRCVAVNVIVSYAGIRIRNYYLTSQYELIRYIVNQSLSFLSEHIQKYRHHTPPQIIKMFRRFLYSFTRRDPNFTFLITL